ncbi:MAG TPA: cellulose synthase operon protein YhjQ/BcsQ [Acidobacteriaceae bacterium]|nr:cellulose synthase operon protein YhjQ/BcsQ [Acidobacteriaceae bacterium]
MDGQKPEAVEEQPRTETPEDVAVLYSWANLQGARYRDFSGSKRESRALLRHRAAQQARDAETRAQAEAEAAAAIAERAAREAEEIARLHETAARKAGDARQRRDLEVEESARAFALRQAAELSRRAAAERVEAARRAEAAAAAEAATRREEREMVEARASAERQALRYAEAELRRRSMAGPQPVSELPGDVIDPYTTEPVDTSGRIFPALVAPEEDMRPARFPQSREGRQRLPPMDTQSAASEAEDKPLAVVDPSLAGDLGSGQESERRRSTEQKNEDTSSTESSPAERAGERVPEVPKGSEEPHRFHERRKAPATRRAFDTGAVPAWLSEEGRPRRVSEEAREDAAGDETLQESRERVASRWFALRELFEQQPREQAAEAQANSTDEVPLLGVFSLAGGVGKTSLVATLGRALASCGEKVLLTDTTSHGLLPFYFGASELKPGVVRMFAPPVGSADAPVHLLSFALNEKPADPDARELVAEELARNGRGMQRVLVDLSPAAAWAVRRLARMNSIILVPMKPDMSSVISLGAVERFFADIADANGKPVHPRYVLNGFDSAQPLHLDVREVLRQQLGDRLLPFVIRRSPAVSEALAEGMTVMDYAPESPVAGDFLNMASWLRTQAAPAPGFRKARWSEQ